VSKEKKNAQGESRWTEGVQPLHHRSHNRYGTQERGPQTVEGNTLSCFLGARKRKKSSGALRLVTLGLEKQDLTQTEGGGREKNRRRQNNKCIVDVQEDKGLLK